MTPGSRKDSMTPLMRQYYRIKSQHPDKILFFRMGDFYEMFGDDAIKAAPILNVALTSRGNIDGEKIPLAGVPYHAMDKYMARLLAAGEKVVVVEQVEDPKFARGVVKREVVEIMTPGTATLEGMTEASAPLYLAAVYAESDKRLGLSYIDLTTGKIYVYEGQKDDVSQRLQILSPREILVPQNSNGSSELSPASHLLTRTLSRRVTPAEEHNFDYRNAVSELQLFFGVNTLDGFGVGHFREGLAAAGAIFRYLKENNRTKLDHITQISPADYEQHMLLDYNTVRNLELVRNLSDNSEQGSLFHSVNRTSTAGGARRLRDSILRPFKSRALISRRMAGVAELYQKRELATKLSQLLKGLPDWERLCGRLGMRKINPRQLASIGDAIRLGKDAVELTQALQAEVFRAGCGAYPELREVADIIERALVEEPPLTSAKGDIIRPGYSDELDRLVESIREAREYIASLQKTERERTGISSLKVGFNKVFGYYIEITRSNLDKTPENYIRKQTLVNAERFITEDLKAKEELILAAEEKIFSLEERLFNELVDAVAQSIKRQLEAAEILAELDLIVSLANLAVEKMYVQPEISDSPILEIKGGRHPVIEEILPTGTFVPNDLNLDMNRERIMILTGPNMSGKSTYLRQIGLIVILAQIGSFVPAEKAVVGLVDRVFTRVGAVDNLARGQSTFLVEMIEASNILNNATENSLILLDEVGRGTSTFDGLSIAWAVVEYINENIKARTVFATHYHELTGLAALYDRVRNFQVAVKRWQEEIVFLHKIVPGGCDDSYGIEVARLAGVPRKVIGRARELLKLLESGKFSQSELARGIQKNINQHSLFEKPPSELEEELRRLDINGMTPLEAFRLLNKWKERLDEQ
ncbi:MAG: DNA mismatch repair protein MutS [bacterium]